MLLEHVKLNAGSLPNYVKQRLSWRFKRVGHPLDNSVPVSMNKKGVQFYSMCDECRCTLHRMGHVAFLIRENSICEREKLDSDLRRTLEIVVSLENDDIVCLLRVDSI